MMEESTSKKILLIGLDNSGKTSIVHSLKGMKSLPKFCEIKPTKGKIIENIALFNANFAIWDLSGQETYRDEHIRDFQKIIKESNKLIYVFDVQDVERYDLALNYYEEIIDLLKTPPVSKDIEISIFLHKFDPDLSDMRPDISNEVFEDLREKIKIIIDKTDLSYQIFKTSIYCLFEKTVID